MKISTWADLLGVGCRVRAYGRMGHKSDDAYIGHGRPSQLALLRAMKIRPRRTLAYVLPDTTGKMKRQL